MKFVQFRGPLCSNISVDEEEQFVAFGPFQVGTFIESLSISIFSEVASPNTVTTLIAATFTNIGSWPPTAAAILAFIDLKQVWRPPFGDSSSNIIMNGGNAGEDDHLFILPVGRVIEDDGKYFVVRYTATDSIQSAVVTLSIAKELADAK